MTSAPVAWMLLCCAGVSAAPQAPVNADSQTQQDFLERVDDYVKLRKTVHEGLAKLKPTKSPETIEVHEHGLSHRLREARRSAKQGDVFTPAITTEFRRLLGIAMHGQDAAKVKTSLRRSEPVHVAIRVNGSYPKAVPLQSMPPTLLLNMPKLPPEVEYRLVGNTLVLFDSGANLIVDYMPNAFPAGDHAQ